MSGEPALPGVLADIERLAGRGAAIDLALQHGGREVYFPAEKAIAGGDDHPLLHVLGAAAALVVCRHVGGNAIYVPRARRACALELARRGKTPAEIAGLLKTSIYTARRYIRRS